MNTDFVKMLLGTVLRHAATAIAGYLVAKGVAQQSETPAIIGMFMTAGALVWSGYQKYGHAIAQDILTRMTAAQSAQVPQQAKMSSVVGAVLLVAFLGLPQLARAADVAAPAPATPVAPVAAAFSAFKSAPCTTQLCTGFYVGFNLAGTMVNANVIGNGVIGTTSDQSIGIQAGYQFWNGTFFFGPELFADYTIGGSPVVAGYPASKWMTGEIVKLGTPFATFFGSTSPPVNTSGFSQVLLNSITSPFILFGSVQRPWGAGIAGGAGIQGTINSNWIWEFKYINVQYTGSNQASPIQTIPQENLGMFSLSYKF